VEGAAVWVDTPALLYARHEPKNYFHAVADNTVRTLWAGGEDNILCRHVPLITGCAADSRTRPCSSPSTGCFDVTLCNRTVCYLSRASVGNMQAEHRHRL